SLSNYFFYRYLRPIEVGEKLYESQNPTKGEQYLMHYIGGIASLLIFCMLLISNLLLVAVLLIFFGVEKPYVLAISLSVLILLFDKTVKYGFYVASLDGECVYNKHKQIEKQQPKSYKAWLESVVQDEENV
ncbi:hypothetical protein QNF14_004247, partial [Vibrio vulnificus]|nr:hypothetical protein [Vibrio vulnificus]